MCLLIICVDLTGPLREAERDIERKAFRVVNHASKRVMSNTAQCCELVVQKLSPKLEMLGDVGVQGRPEGF